jgi:flagellar biosynthetic protein FliQ
MSASAVLSQVHGMLVMTLLLATPFLAAAVVSSFVIGVLQAAIRVNDLTLSFIPRFVAVMVVISLAASWLAGRMVGYIEHSAAAMRAILG